MVRIAPLDRKLLRDMWRMRGHLAAVALVAACGAATYVTMRGAYEGLSAARARFYDQYRFADVFATVKRAPRSLLPRIERIPGVSSVADRVEQEVTLDMPDMDEPVTVRVVSVPDRRRPALNDVFIQAGRFPDANANDEVLVGEAFARAHRLHPGSLLSGAINGRWQKLRVIGIAGSPEFVHVIGGAGVFPDDRRYGVLWKGRAGMEASLDMTDAFNSVSLRLSPGADQQAVMDRLDTLLARYGSGGAYGRGDHFSHQMLDGEIEQDRVTGIVLPAIFLGVAAFLIYNVLTRLIGLQRAQIGVLKAFGYGNGAVLAHYLKLAAGAVLAGCVIGVGFGVWLGRGLASLYRNFFHMPGLDFHLSAVNVVGVVFVCGIAAVAGALPALLRVLRLPPAEAMRPAQPPRYRPLLLERLGRGARLSPAMRMIFRNLERRPIRALVSILAVSLSVALLVVSQFGLDALDETVRVQFRAARRDDVRVAFHEARGTQVRHDLAHLPGVLQVEAIRTVPARIRNEHRVKRLLLFGLPANHELQRILDLDLREVPLPPDGLVLTASLARRLAVAPGQSLQIEFLQGERRVRRVPVVATVDEPIGLYGYMDERALARLMGEGVAYTDAYLRVDARQLDALYARLKQLPTLAGVTLREATLRSFLSTVAENLLISVWVLIGFACAIAAGVVYNGARIALSEHAITLASLRILGFTQREVSAILLGEQAVLVAVAIPVGCVLGLGLSAWLASLLETELYRLPLSVSTRTLASAAGSVVVAAVASSVLVAWRLRRLDLVEVLKTRE